MALCTYIVIHLTQFNHQNIETPAFNSMACTRNRLEPKAVAKFSKVIRGGEDSKWTA
jgi:hypothetical protein